MIEKTIIIISIIICNKMFKLWKIFKENWISMKMIITRKNRADHHIFFSFISKNIK